MWEVEPPTLVFMEKVEILGVKIDNLTMEEALGKVEQLMNDRKQHYIVTPNPLFLVEAQKNKEFRETLNAADLAVADGIGLIFAAWFLSRPIKQRITGLDLMEKICQLAKQKNWLVFLFGGKEGVAEKTAENLKKKYLGLALQVGVPTAHISPVVLFVALGPVKQEKWIVENLKRMPSVKLAIGVGGAFDFLAGRARLAPKILRAAGLEWFWRLAFEPWRIKRVLKSVVVFPWLVVKGRIF